MFLKKLVLKGFKTFAEKTSLEFEPKPGIVCIVGPNGCGKSNLVDAIKWVIGEQAMKELRGERLGEVIFAGTQTRKPLSAADVSLVLDNQDGRLKSEYAEVEVKRRVYRSGESEFYLNQNACRLKHIRDLFFDTGLGRESYSIISQGQVDAILNSKPEERRAIFEEAAEIQQYKYRRAETQKKLISTEQNMLRLQDLKHELENQYAALAEQSKQARHYQTLKASLKQLEIAFFKKQAELLVERKQEVTLQKESLRCEIAALTEHIQHRREELSAQAAKQEEREQQVEAIREQVEALRESVENAGSREHLEGERLSGSADRLAQLFEEREKLAQFLVNAETKWREAQSDLEGLEVLKQQKELALREQEENWRRVRDQAEAWEQEVAGLKELLFELERESARVKQTWEGHRAGQVRNKGERADFQAALLQKKEESAGLEQQKSAFLKAQEEEAQAEVKLKQGLAERAKERRECAKALEDKEKTFFELTATLSRLTSKLSFLREVGETFEGYQPGVRAILKLKQEGDLLAQSVLGVVGELLNVPADYQMAMESVLGEKLQWVVTETTQGAIDLIHYLKQEGLGKATFLSLEACQAEQIFLDQALLTHSLGSAYQLVKYPSLLEPIAKLLLGSVWCFQELEAARTFLTQNRTFPRSLKLVTLAGEVLQLSGLLKGGSRQQGAHSFLGRDRELRDLEREHHGAEQTAQSVGKDCERLRATLTRCDEAVCALLEQEKEVGVRARRVGGELEQVLRTQAAIAHEIERMTQRISLTEQEENQGEEEGKALSVRLTALAAEQEQKKIQLHEREQSFSIRQQEREGALNQRMETKVILTQVEAQAQEKERTAAAYLVERQSFQEALEKNQATEREFASLYQRIESQQFEAWLSLPERRVELATLTEQLKMFQAEQKKLREWHHSAEIHLNLAKDAREILGNRYGKEEVKETKLGLEIEAMTERIQTEYHLSLADLQAQEVDAALPLTRAKPRLAELRQAIEAMGAVNLLAIQEFEEMERRRQELVQQLEDLAKSREHLGQIFLELDQRAKEHFLSTLEVINRHFSEIFGMLFEGGEAKLSLTQEENVLEAGIEILARPAGKKWLSLSLLSGGEKALTAIALLFSLLKTHPSPFCWLDEVDAPLDESNVVRFTRLLKAFSQDFQLILITHCRETMASADLLYGVTMEEPGVSRMVSLKFKEAASEAVESHEPQFHAAQVA